LTIQTALPFPKTFGHPLSGEDREEQKRLLEDDDLSNVAIAARVSKGVVTLSGTVPNAKLRDRALEIARGAPGTGTVESRIEVDVAATKQVDR